jgi:hypothetical protein
MYTIDTFIERLKQLRSILPDGGQTPVVIETHDGSFFETVAVEAQDVFQVTPELWVTRSDGNDKQVCKVF